MIIQGATMNMVVEAIHMDKEIIHMEGVTMNTKATMREALTLTAEAQEEVAAILLEMIIKEVGSVVENPMLTQATEVEAEAHMKIAMAIGEMLQKII